MSDRAKSLINGVNVSGLTETIANIKKDPSLGQCEFRLQNQWVKGDENHSETKDFFAAGAEQKHKKNFHFKAGEPELLQGKDDGANPVEYLLSALSGCITTTIVYYAAINGYKVEEMKSNYTGYLDLQGLFGLDSHVRPGFQKIDVEFNIKSDAPLSELEKYYKFSPVYDVVSKSVPINLTIHSIK